MLYSINSRKGVRVGEELKAPCHASAAATRDGHLPSRDGSLPYVTAICLIPNTNKNKNLPYTIYFNARTSV